MNVPLRAWFSQIWRSRLTFGLAAAIIFAVASPTIAGAAGTSGASYRHYCKQVADGFFPDAVQNGVDRINRNCRRNAANRPFPVYSGKKDRHDQYFHL